MHKMNSRRFRSRDGALSRFALTGAFG